MRISDWSSDVCSSDLFLDRGIEEVDQIERAMLRISAYELQHRIDVPYRVIIGEALKAVKRFGSEHGHTYVNGVLDNAAAEWRAHEMQVARGRSEEHTSELHSLIRISYADICMRK